MSIDMSQFYQVFFDESAEHLENMESQLLSLDLDAPDPDQLNAIFRSAHSIKGGSGTFGFTDMTEVTHVLETLLDRIRKNEIAITAEMVDVFLEAGDVLRNMLEAHQSGDVADEDAAKKVCRRLVELSSESAANHIAEAAIVDSVVAEPAVAERTDVIVSPPKYRISFPNTPEIFATPTHLENLIEDLANHGQILNRTQQDDRVNIELLSSASDKELRDIFSFFLSADQLLIELLTPQSAVDEAYGFFDEPTLSKAKEDDDQGYGFFVTPQQLKDTVEQEQGYGFFDPPVEVGTTAEDQQGYGFFVAPEQLKGEQENAQGYGFFEEPEQVKAKVENAQGYGFFTELAPTVAETKAPSVAVVEEVVKPKPIEKSEKVEKAAASKESKDAHAAESSIRVSVEKVDQMINLVGELVITQSMLAEIASRLDPVINEHLLSGLTQLERNTRELQESVMSVRMMPINFVFSRFPRVVRDLASKLGKKVQLKMVGENTELDKGLIEKISDPLTHLVRNSLDHGIEPPDVRIEKGKDPQGTVTLLAAHQGGNIVIQVMDDGGGLNREKILAKAKEKNLPVNDSMSDADVWMLIFAPGFSTAAVVTDVSGRGVGMDVVKKNIEGIGGRVEIASQFGQGSTITIRLPLTLAILDGLSIAVGDQTYIVPLGFITESLQPRDGDIKEISGQGQVIFVRGEYLPVIALHKVFNIKPKVTKPRDGIFVLLEAEGKKVALFVDELVGQHQVVIKSLETNYRRIPGISGATIMGDGRVAMIMDVTALVKLVQK